MSHQIAKLIRWTVCVGSAVILGFSSRGTVHAAQTSTRLADYGKAKPQCPCDYSATHLAALGFTGVANGCLVTNRGAVFGTHCAVGPSGPGGCSAPLINVQSGIFNPPVFAVCSIIAPPGEPLSDRELTEDEFTACRDEVIQAAQARGVICVRREGGSKDTRSKDP